MRAKFIEIRPSFPQNAIILSDLKNSGFENLGKICPSIMSFEISLLFATISGNLQRTTYYFIQKRKILKRSAGQSKTIKGSIYVFTQEGNQCGLSLLAFSCLFNYIFVRSGTINAYNFCDTVASVYLHGN